MAYCKAHDIVVQAYWCALLHQARIVNCWPDPWPFLLSPLARAEHMTEPEIVAIAEAVRASCLPIPLDTRVEICP